MKRVHIQAEAEEEKSSTSSKIEESYKIPDLDSCYDNYSQSFINIASKYNDSKLETTRVYSVDSCVPIISLQSRSNVVREFQFNDIFPARSPHAIKFKKVMIPLLKTVMKDYQDASLILYGGRGTGKTRLLGTFPEFYKHENLLVSTLGFIFEQMPRNSQSLSLSCFEVLSNKIIDLMAEKREFHNEKIKSIEVHSYSEAVDILELALSQRSISHSRKDLFPSHLGHIFITLDIHQNSLNSSLSSFSQNRGILTLVELAGHSLGEDLVRLSKADPENPELWTQKSLSFLKQYLININYVKNEQKIGLRNLYNNKILNPEIEIEC